MYNRPTLDRKPAVAFSTNAFSTSFHESLEMMVVHSMEGDTEPRVSEHIWQSLLRPMPCSPRAWPALLVLCHTAHHLLCCSLNIQLSRRKGHSRSRSRVSLSCRVMPDPLYMKKQLLAICWAFLPHVLLHSVLLLHLPLEEWPLWRTH